VIVRIQALRYRGLRYVDQPVDRFRLLVGPNASGKSTFVDVVGFLGDLVQVARVGRFSATLVSVSRSARRRWRTCQKTKRRSPWPPG
jgi:predicted ATPase